MGNSVCCSSDDANTKFDVVSTTEEQGDGYNTVAAQSETTLVHQVAATTEAEGSPSAATAATSAADEDQSPSAASVDRDASREKKDQEVKEKLGVESPKKAKHTQAVVRDFVKGMLSGHFVTLLTYIGTGEGQVQRSDAVMKLDKAIQTLSLTCKDGNIACPLDKIQDVYHVEGDGKEVFPGKVTESLSEEELGRLLMVFYTLEDSSKKAFLMLEATAESRSQFHQCGKILSAHVMREKAKVAEKAA